MLSRTSRALAQRVTHIATPSAFNIVEQATVAHNTWLTHNEPASLLCHHQGFSTHLLIRCYSQGARDAPSTTPAFVYEGPFGKTVTNLKRLSIASCAATTLTSPLLVALTSDVATPMTMKAAIAATICSFGMFTTGLLHWFTSPYVQRLVHHAGTNEVTLETKGMLGGTVTTVVQLDKDIQPANTMQPLSTFQAKGRVFYVDADNFADKQLLMKLTPLPEGATEGG